MSWRTVVVSSRSKLELKNSYLVIRNEVVRRVHINEIAVLIVENTGCSLTAALLSELWDHKVNVIFCDSKRNPGAQLIPLYNSFDCSAKVHSQVLWKQDITEVIWAEIVKEKIRKQSELLKAVNLNYCSGKLLEYMADVLPGDESNREGHAAKVYFNSLFGNQFSRSNDCVINTALNYGYSIILSAINREIVANGYLTQLGIFHKSVFNHFNLACDLMEPFRPIIDDFVIKLKLEDQEELNHVLKMNIVNILNLRVIINKSKQTILNAIGIYVKSVLDALDSRDISLIKFYDYEFQTDENNSIL